MMHYTNVLYCLCTALPSVILIVHQPVTYLYRFQTWQSWGLQIQSAPDVINHDGRKIGRFEPRRFFYVNMHISASMFAFI